MNNTDKSGYAYPADMKESSVRYAHLSYGLTKRELFAMAAMQGLTANAIFPMTIPDVANVAVRQADALLAELAK